MGGHCSSLGDPLVPGATRTAWPPPATGTTPEGYKGSERTLQSRKTLPRLVRRCSLECVLPLLFFFFPLFLFICNKCRRGGGDSEEVFVQTPVQSQDCVWLPDRLVLGPGRELPAAPQPNAGTGEAGGSSRAGPSAGSTRMAKPGALHTPFCGGR